MTTPPDRLREVQKHLHAIRTEDRVIDRIIHQADQLQTQADEAAARKREAQTAVNALLAEHALSAVRVGHDLSRADRRTLHESVEAYHADERVEPLGHTTSEDGGWG